MSKAENGEAINPPISSGLFPASLHGLSIVAAATMLPWRLSAHVDWQEQAQLPFIYWLIRAFKPTRLVALGLNAGDTYSLFCQVVKEASLRTVCYAIDPYRCDAQNGNQNYEAMENMWHEYSDYNRIHFASFSSLIRSDYNEALARFHQNSIDLVYLNSGRSYGHLRHQFQSWLPMLTPVAAVLVPAINRREIGWDAWRFWQELTNQYPGRTLSFMHGQGTGVLFPGASPPPHAVDLCELDHEVAHEFQSLFAAFGQSAVKHAEITTLRQTVLERDHLISSLYDRLREFEVKILDHHQETALSQSQLRSEMSQLSHQLSDILQSRSWRLFAPVRNIVDRIRPRAGAVRSFLERRYAKAQSISQLHTFNPTVIASEVATIRESGLFDEAYYRSMYGDELSDGDPIVHYCQKGWLSGNNPSDDFDTNFYLSTYDDIRNAGLNPFWHFIYAGASELRHALPDQKPRYEEDIWYGKVLSDIQLVAFFSNPNWLRLRSDRLQSPSQSQRPIPCDELGFYDQADADVLRHQALLACRHGLRGFCFQLNWLDTLQPSGVDRSEDTAVPLVMFLTNPQIEFDFLVQFQLPHSSGGCPSSLIDSLVSTASDPRYIRIGSRPVFLVDLSIEDGQCEETLARLRSGLSVRGFDQPYLIGMISGVDMVLPINFSADICDAWIDKPTYPFTGETGQFTPLLKNGFSMVPYRVVATHGIARAEAMQHSPSPTFHSISPGRHSSGQNEPLVYSRFTLRDYRAWLDVAMTATRSAHPADRRFLFLNGWNDWSEGVLLEPDRLRGYGRLNEITRALLSIPTGMRMPKVSVIVPNYNHAEFLPRRLDSIYSQSYKNIEVILLDDCSSDSSCELMNTFASTHSDITRTIYNQNNSGSVFRQWARGIKAATGELIWIAESDDFCDLDFLEQLVRAFDDEAVMLAYARCMFVDRNELPLQADFAHHVSDLACSDKWNAPYVETAHNEVRSCLGIKNTIPNVSGVVFKRPVSLALLDDPVWLSMRVAGDWIFYLHIIKAGRIAFCYTAKSYFRRYPGSAADLTYKQDIFYREVGLASKTVATLYDVSEDLLQRSRKSFKLLYDHHIAHSDPEFENWYDYASVLMARKNRIPTVLITTMGFFPGGAEILPIRMANEFRRQGIAVLLLSTGLNPREDGVRRMLRNDVPLVETSDIATVKNIIHDFGIDVLNTHQWHIQKYPLQVNHVFSELRAHVASLHGMIEHGDAFAVTDKHLRAADRNVSSWVYTADKNLGPFVEHGIIDSSKARFIKLPNGMEPPNITLVKRMDMGIPEDAFVLCCVSRAIPDKGWAETIRVVERARTLVDRDIRLILVGNGPVHEEYLRKGVPDYVYLAGFSENSVGYYAASDMGIMLTKFKSESFPLTIVDCLFAGKPYIATDVGEIKNMLTLDDVMAGQVVSLHDWEVPIEEVAHTVAAYASNPAIYAKAIEPVSDLSQRFRIDVVADQYIKIFIEDFSSSRMSQSRLSG